MNYSDLVGDVKPFTVLLYDYGKCTRQENGSKVPLISLTTTPSPSPAFEDDSDSEVSEDLEEIDDDIIPIKPAKKQKL
uniref:Uncharacterized protein n=1 Tax=Anguilla anguilla TaxID=7936 RepID=A0A0E9WYT5_ANGAN